MALEHFFCNISPLLFFCAIVRVHDDEDFKIWSQFFLCLLPNNLNIVEKFDKLPERRKPFILQQMS